MCSCGASCGPISTCGGHCTSRCSGNACSITCEYYCLHSNCSFNCGGDHTIETNPSNCNGVCISSSCSATGRLFYFIIKLTS